MSALYRVHVKPHDNKSKFLELLKTEGIEDLDAKYDNPHTSHMTAAETARKLAGEIADTTKSFATCMRGTQEGNVWVVFKGGSSFASVFVTKHDKEPSIPKQEGLITDRNGNVLSNEHARNLTGYHETI